MVVGGSHVCVAVLVLFQLHYIDAACFGTSILTARRGTITDGGYGPMSRCHWILRPVPPYRRIFIRFTSFEVRTGGRLALRQRRVCASALLGHRSK